MIMNDQFEIIYSFNRRVSKYCALYSGDWISVRDIKGCICQIISPLPAWNGTVARRPHELLVCIVQC